MHFNQNAFKNDNIKNTKPKTKMKNNLKEDEVNDISKLKEKSSAIYLKNKRSSLFNKEIIANFKEPKMPGYYYLILINLNQTKIKAVPKSKYILNYYNFNQALKNDDRDFWRITFIYLLSIHSIFHTFFFKSYLEPQSLRICLFIFRYACDFFLNAFFYLDNKISERYHYDGDSLFLYSFINNIIITICSTLISFFLRIFLKYLTNSILKLEAVFREVEKKIRKKNKIDVTKKQKDIVLKQVKGIMNCLQKKILVFVILELILMMFFTFYVSAFCSVYKKTQNSWLTDGISSVFLSIIYEFLIAFFTCLIYNTSIKVKVECLYKISMFIYNIGH